MISYEETEEFDRMLLAVQKLRSENVSNVKIHGEYLVVVPDSDEMDGPMVYIGSLGRPPRSFSPSRPWVEESLRDSGITTPHNWIEWIDLRRMTEGDKEWLEQRLATKWTKELMLQYAVRELL